jgi:triacylglycerol esterase/lipase EstA (alpha/beta hydrolase family)
MKTFARLSCFAFGVAAAVVTAAPVAAEPAAPALPVPDTIVAAYAAGITNPDSAPAGANDWSCRPTAAHPNPVVLVHGTTSNMTYSWTTLAPLLKNNGYCVFALNYGQQPGANIASTSPGSTVTGATGPIEDSAVQLSAFIDRVTAATGAAKVDIVGHSQGGMMPRYYLKYLNGAASVDKLIGLAPSNHGTTLALDFAADFAAGRQQGAGSDFLANLNSGGDTVAGVTYTVIASRYDEIVTPYTSQFLTGPNVTNITLQDTCPQNFAEHLALPYDDLSVSYVLQALDADYPVAACTFSAPILGN